MGIIIPFHFSISYMGCHPSHRRTPSFFKMGTLHHQPVVKIEDPSCLRKPQIDFLFLVPSGYLLHSHGKSPCFLIGKPSISIRAIYTMAMLVITRGYHLMIKGTQFWPIPLHNSADQHFKKNAGYLDWTCILDIWFRLVSGLPVTDHETTMKSVGGPHTLTFSIHQEWVDRGLHQPIIVIGWASEKTPSHSRWPQNKGGLYKPIVTRFIRWLWEGIS